MMSALQLNNLAVIPARGGSKGIPRKNITLLNNKPMLAYTIETALQSGCFSRVIVSTDDNEIAEIAKQFGAEIPFIRPVNLATDNTTTQEVIQHAVRHFDNQQIFHDVVSILQPTSPLRSTEDIIQAVALFTQRNADSVVSVAESGHSPLWMNTLPEDHSLENFISLETMDRRRQDLPIHYCLNGAIYIIKARLMAESKSIYTKNSFAYIMPRERSIDVDNMIDLICCEALLKNRSSH